MTATAAPAVGSPTPTRAPTRAASTTPIPPGVMPMLPAACPADHTSTRSRSGMASPAARTDRDRQATSNSQFRNVMTTTMAQSRRRRCSSENCRSALATTSSGGGPDLRRSRCTTRTPAAARCSSRRRQAGIRRLSRTAVIPPTTDSAGSSPRTAATALPEISNPTATISASEIVDSTPDTASANAAAWCLIWRRSSSR